MAHSRAPLLLMVAVLVVTAAGARQRCGGIYTAARGVLQTPGFPNTLPVPIQCEWVIDAQNLASPNTSIVVYLTQLYVHEGLTFTEYQVYDRTYQVDGRVVHTVNETNVVQVRWVQSFQDFLVVNLKLDTIDSAHLRVLDRFLDVYGFNITYEITKNPVRADACTMMDCGFTGTCYDHYTKFSCDCFHGYAGPHCSSGPKSFCDAHGDPTCKNGGTCIHVGASAVKCYCQREFMGDTCQIPLASVTKSECETCVMSCSFDGKLQNACKCPKPVNGSALHDRVGFACTMHLSNLPSLSGDQLKSFISNQIYRTLKANYSRTEDVTVESVAYFRSGVDVTFHLFIPRKDEKRIRSIFTKWADRGYIANLTVADKEFILRPLLDLQGVSINQPSVVRQQDEFILSCVARGSPTMAFRWFKDGIFVNITESTSHKWNRLIKDPHTEDQYTALLGVERASGLDAGLFTCQVEDFRVQQCLSRRVQVRTNPVIKVEPMSLTVRKGENFTIKCISMGNNLGKHTYSWTKNKELLPVRSSHEKYEILYPGGSILQVFGVEKSVKYSCLVQVEDTSSEESIDVHVVNPDLVQTCPSQDFLNITWPETAPDTDSLQECPKDYAFPGLVRRSCRLKDGLRPVWQLPDYSCCTPEPLHRIQLDFQLMEVGYEASTPQEIVLRSLEYLQSRSESGLFPGEGARILRLARDVISYAKRYRHSPPNITAAVFDVVDGVLMRGNSLIDQEQVKLLQEVVSRQVEVSSLLVETTRPLFRLSRRTIDLTLMAAENNGELLLGPFDKTSFPYWTAHKALVSLKSKSYAKKAIPSVLAVVVYRNLTAFLPVRSVIRLKDGTEVEYEVISHIVRVWVSTQEHSSYFDSFVTLEWRRNLLENASKEGWFLRCAVAEVATFSNSWNTSACVKKVLNVNTTRCICPNMGTFALLLTTNTAQTEKEEHQSSQYVVLAGCCLCFLSGLTCTIILTTHWVLKRSCIIFLKLQCSFSVTGVMMTFALASVGNPPEVLFPTVMAAVEILLLMGMSSHISTLLVVYTELVNLPKAAVSKQMVIGISTGVPVIAVFGNHLAHRTMEVRLRSWWLLAGTLAFDIFVTVTGVIVALFLFLHFAVAMKLRKLKTVHEKNAKAVRRRRTLLHRSACIFCALVVATVCSILYINFLEMIWCHYAFCATAMLLAIALFVCYIAKSENEFHEFFKGKGDKDAFYGLESTGSPLNFFTKEEADVESECIPNHHHHPHGGGASKPVECFPMADACKSGLPECVSGAIEAFYDRGGGGGGGAAAATAAELERYNRSPQLYRKSTTFKIDDVAVISRSPDIIASKMCTQLDIVVSHAPSIVITPEESIGHILAANGVVGDCRMGGPPESSREIATLSERVDLEANSSKAIATISGDRKGDKLDGMLDRISHDLDYLLNRGEEPADICSSSSSSAPAAMAAAARKISKPPAPSVIQEIAEEAEDEVKVPEAITDILRTSC